MAIKKEFFRQVMGHFATGVTVVTTNSQGTLAGLTVNSFASVSLNPPLVLVCIDMQSNTLSLLRESKKFAVNMLTENQEQWSRGFATDSPERFEHFCYAPHHTAATGAPIIEDALAFIDARIIAEYPGGDHVIFLGQVEAMGVAGQAAFVNEEGQNVSSYADTAATASANPLLYYAGQYRQIEQQFHEPSLPAEPEQEQNIEEPVRGR